MDKDKAAMRWAVNVMAFIFFILLAVTGVISWVLPSGGYRSVGGFLVSLRHFLCEVHEWSALLFMAIVAIHIWLHWSYISVHLKKMKSRA